MRVSPHTNRNKTHCHRGHPLSGDNLYPRKDGGRDCRACRVLWKEKHHRRVMRNYAKRRRAEGKFHYGYLPSVVKRTDPGLLRHAIEMVRQTGSRAAAHELIGYQRWRAIMAYEPRLKRQVQKLIVRRRTVVVAPSIIRATDDIMDAIEAAVPRHLPPDHRADVIQNIWLAVLEGRLKRSEIAELAREYINAEYRINHNAWGPRSLDVPIYLDASTTLLDTLTRGLWD
jgi:hypothetical protein